MYFKSEIKKKQFKELNRINEITKIITSLYNYSGCFSI